MYTRIGECLINTEKILDIRQVEQGLLLRLGERSGAPDVVGLILPHAAVRASEFFSRFVEGQPVVYLNEINERETASGEASAELRRSGHLTLQL